MSSGSYPIKPETVDEIKEAETVQGKRARIYRYAYHDSLTAAVSNMAQHTGMSQDDMMVVLAYEALCSREKLLNDFMTQAILSPAPRTIIVSEREKAGG